MRSVIAFLLFVFAAVAVHAQQMVLRKDLQPEWKVFHGNRYKPFGATADPVKTIYFNVDVRTYRGDVLRLEGTEPFHIFVNGRLAGMGKSFALPVDSMAKAFSTSVLSLAVHQSVVRAEGLTTRLEYESLPSEQPLARRTAYFRDFAIVGMLVLMLLVVLIIRLNPKLASDYFSVTKIFSLRESDDSQAYSRITSSTNILFYVFCSLMLGYYLMVVFHFLPAHYASALLFQPQSFGGAMWQWAQLSFVLLGVFFLKIILVYGLTLLFGVPEVAGIHFFNWVRLMLLVFGALTIVLSCYFMMHGQQQHFFSLWLQLLAWVMGAWMILIILKLAGRMRGSMFHLFSYICATELIPFLITLKVLYN